jgi:hypothetical protein
MNEILTKMGIIHETTVPYTPEENGSVERDNRTVIEMARTMLHASPLQANLWAEMIDTAVYLHNRVPNRKDIVSPFEAFTGRKPRIDHLRIIGSTVFVGIPKALRTKWDEVSWSGILVGYGDSTKFYRVYNPENERVITCKDVQIHEDKERKKERRITKI